MTCSGGTGSTGADQPQVYSSFDGAQGRIFQQYRILVGSTRLFFLILSERHLRRVMKDYQEYVTTRAPIGVLGRESRAS